MIDPSVLPVFIAAVLVILVAPGPDMMFMIGSGLKSGRRGAVAAAFGVTSGVSIYVFGSAFGLARLIEEVPQVLDGIRLLGAGYLAWLAWGTFREAGTHHDLNEIGPTSNWQIFRQGFVVNITNPKVALFIAAFIPQFVDPSLGNTTAQFLFFAVSFQLLGLLVDLAVGLGAGSARALLLRRPGIGRVLDYLAATVYLLIASWLVFELLR